MARKGYCTVEDVRDVFQDNGFTGALAANNDLAVQKAIAAQTQWVQKATKRHWYVSGGLSEDKRGMVFSDVLTRDDEEDISTHAGYVDGAYGDDRFRATNTSGTVFSSNQTASAKPKQQIRLDRGDLEDDTTPAYTRVQLARKDADALNSLHIANASGGYDDWVASNDYDGGVGFSSHVGDDFYVRINSGGVSELYIDVHSLDDDIAYLSSAVLVDFDYGQDELPQSVRQGVAKLAASYLILDDDLQTAIPDDGQLVNLETKADRWERQGRERLTDHIEEDYLLPREQQ